MMIIPTQTTVAAAIVRSSMAGHAALLVAWVRALWEGALLTAWKETSGRGIEGLARRLCA